MKMLAWLLVVAGLVGGATGTYLYWRARQIAEARAVLGIAIAARRAVVTADKMRMEETRGELDNALSDGAAARAAQLRTRLSREGDQYLQDALAYLNDKAQRGFMDIGAGVWSRQRAPEGLMAGAGAAELFGLPLLLLARRRRRRDLAPV